MPLFVLGLALPIAQAILIAGKAEFPTPRHDTSQSIGLRILTAGLHLMQPMARLIGRLRHGLTPSRARPGTATADHALWGGRSQIWGEKWRYSDDWLNDIRQGLRTKRTLITMARDYDLRDLQVRGGMLGGVRLAMAVEKHGAGTQLVKFRARSRIPFSVAALFFVLLLFFAAALTSVWVASVVSGSITLLLVRRF